MSKLNKNLEAVYLWFYKNSAWIVLILLANSLLLCTAHYLTFRALWLDEAFVASSLKFRSLQGLSSILDYGQQFPRLYLSVIYGLKTLVGYHIWSLRLLPYLFSLGSVIIWVKIFYDELNNKNTILALTGILLFLSNHFVYYYAGELKQYSADLFWAGYAFWFAKKYIIPALNKGIKSWTGVAALWLFPCLVSLTYPFVVFAVAIGYLLPYFFKPIPNKWPKILIGTTLGSILVGLLFFSDLQFTMNDTLLTYWRNNFISGNSVGAWGHSLFQGLTSIIGRWWTKPSTYFFTALGLIGAGVVIRFIRKENSFPLARVGLVLLLELLILAALKKYPLEYGRTNLFFFPYASGLILMGLMALYESKNFFIKWAGVGAIGLTLLLMLAWKIPSVSKAYYRYQHWEDINPAMHMINKNISELVVYSQGSKPQVEAFPDQPSGFNFKYQGTINMKDIIEAEKILGPQFYYIYAYPNGEINDLVTPLELTYKYKQLVNHLYFFEKI